MAKSCRQFADLLSNALDRIKASGKTKQWARKKIADAIDRSPSVIEHWQRGNCPSTDKQTEITAKFLKDNRGLSGREAFELFLDYAGHSSPSTAWSRLFARVDGPERDEFDIFIGREEQVEEVASAVQWYQVVVLWGQGGVGKTSLVRKVIQKLAPNNTLPQQFPDGILYYPFSDNERTADHAFRYIAKFYDVEVKEKDSPRDIAFSALRDKKALIILDSAEATDELRNVRSIRQQCGILIVSRYQYSDLADKIIHLGTLPIDEAITALQAWSTNKNSHSDFQVWSDNSNEDCQIAYEICEQLGRLPLALRLAGRYMLQGKKDPASFLSQWPKRNLSLLAQKGDHQHDSIDVMMEKSLEQVSEDAREVMAVVGVLSDQPFDSQVIAVTLEKTPSIVENILEDLWKYSLITRNSTKRWQVDHQLIHAYAKSINTTEDVIARLAKYFTALAHGPYNLIRVNENEEKRRTVCPHESWCDFEDKVKSLTRIEQYKWLELERAHILPVLNKCLAQQQWRHVLGLSYAINDYLCLQGYINEREIVLQMGLTAAKAWQDCTRDDSYDVMIIRMFISHICKWLGDTCYDKGEWDQAIQYYRQALPYFEEGDLGNIVEVLVDLSTTYYRNGEREQATNYYHQALQASKPIDDMYVWVRQSCGHLDVYSIEQEWKDQAIQHYRQALDTARRAGDRFSLATSYYELGTAYQDKGEWDQAIQYYQQALPCFELEEDLQSIDYLTSSYRNLGTIYQDKGEWDQAIQYYRQALDTARRTGNIPGLAEIYNKLGDAYQDKGEWDQAIQYYQQAFEINKRKAFNTTDVATFYCKLGDAYQGKGEGDQALQYYRQALSYFEEGGGSYYLAGVFHKLARVYEELGQYQAALDYYERALVICRSYKNKFIEEEVILSDLGDTYYLLHRKKEAIQAYQGALDLNPDNAAVCNKLARTYLDLGQLNEAVQHYQRRIELRPEDAVDAHVALGVVARHRGQETEAQNYFETALAMVEDAPNSNLYIPTAL